IRCDPLPLEVFGTIKWFFSSAMRDPVLYFGEAIAVTNPSITNVYAVRGQTDNDNWVHIYFGLDAHNPKFSNATYSVYQGNILYVVSKNISPTEKNNYYFSFDAKCLDSATINAEISKYIKVDSPAFPYVFKNLFLRKNGSDYICGCLISSVC